MNRTEVSVLKEADEIGLRRLLKRQDGVGLKPEVTVEPRGDLPNQALERTLPEQELSRLLVAADLAKSHCARAVAVRLLLFGDNRPTLFG